MKPNKKYLYIIGIIISLFIGIIGTLFTVNYRKGSPIQQEVKKVNITETNTIKEAVDKIYDAVVLIQSYKGKEQISSGTGFFYKKEGKKGYLITNHHVIEGATQIKVKNINGIETEAHLLGSDAYSDIAVLSVEEDFVLKVAEIGSSTKVEVGDTIFTVGSPLGEDYMGTVTKGILSGKNRTVTISSNSGGAIMEVLQTDAAINPGNSGGPLVNMNGEVIGVNSIKLVQDEIEGMGFSIPIEIAMTSVEKLEKGEKIVRPMFGISMIEIDNIYTLYRNNIEVPENIKEGIVVALVENNTPAKEAGLQKGDIIIQLDKSKIDSVATFRHTLYKYSVGDKVKVKFYRGKEIKEVKVTLNKEA